MDNYELHDLSSRSRCSPLHFASTNRLYSSIHPPTRKLSLVFLAASSSLAAVLSPCNVAWSHRCRRAVAREPRHGTFSSVRFVFGHSSRLFLSCCCRTVQAFARVFFLIWRSGTASELSVSFFVFRELSFIMAGSMAAIARRSRRFMSSSSSSSAAAVASSGSWWKDVQPAARDPILGVTEAFLADTHPSKMNVGVVRFSFLIPCVFVSFFLFDLS